MNTGRRYAWTRILLVATFLLTIGGCVQESQVAGERIFQYETWVPLSVLLAGLVAIPMGLGVRKKNNWLGWTIVVAGPIAAIVFAPSLFRDRVTVSNERFHVRTGIWGLT